MFENWQNSIPICSKDCALILFLINICFPSLGTLIMASLVKPCSIDQLIVAILQFITIPVCFVGWIWSIWWGYLCYRKGDDIPDHAREENPSKI